MTRSELLKITNMIYDIGESPEHYANMDTYTDKGCRVYLYIFKQDGSGIDDSISINSLDDEAIAWIERWTERLRKERVLNDTH